METLIESRKASLAVSIMVDGRVMACLGVVWMHTSIAAADAIDQYYLPLLQASHCITQDYEKRRIERAVHASTESAMLDANEL